MPDNRNTAQDQYTDAVISGKQPFEPSINKMVTLSTGHLSKNTRQLLCDEAYIESTSLAVYEKTSFDTTFGWFIYPLEGAENSDLPEDLLAIVRYAKALSCSVICLDRDTEPIEKLPKYMED